MSTFRVLVFRDVSLVGRFEVFKPAKQRNNSAVETSYFAFAALLI
jgi:hypothetical protein